MSAAEKIEIGAQPGPQREFLSSRADIVIYGGAAGGGKTYGLLLDPLRNYHDKHFGGVIFRRTSVQIRSQGGLWDTSMTLYPLIGGKPRGGVLEWGFPTGMGMSFANLEYEKDVHNYQGSQMPWIGFDELTHFSENQFFYMLSRNRSPHGAPSCVRATCNPDPDSWVKGFIRYWLDENGQFPIPERSGKIRYFIRVNDQIIWADSPEEIFEQYGRSDDIQPTSATFIAARLEDNKILMEKDKKYKANLLAMNRVDRMRLLYGDWNARVTSGSLFRREWFPIVDSIPGGWIQVIRFWDRAATKPNEGNRDPDWTRGLKLYKYPNGTYCIGDLKSERDTPGQIENLVKNTAMQDGYQVRVMSQQDPGSAGVAEAEHFIKMLAGFDAHVMTTSKDKETRAKPVSAQCEWGNVSVLRAPWNEGFFSELENFPEGSHDDQVDVLSGAFNEMSGGISIADVL